jgi:Tfp pilus assembly protein PilV
MTLIEVLMAVVILGTVLVGLMQGLTQCLAAFSLARRVQGMHSVANLGEIQHPMFIESDPETDLEVPPDSNIAEGYTFERTCEFASEDEEENLYIVHTIVKYGRGGAGNELALTRYVYYKE